MGLQAAFDLVLSSSGETTLTRLRHMAVQQLVAASNSHRHPWHTGVVATIDEGKPRVRTVVLRYAADAPLTLRFHTDIRSTKMSHLRENSHVEWLFYEPSTRIQLRVEAVASVLTEGDVWSESWSRTRPSSRRCYLGPQPPGSAANGPYHNLPSELLDRDPTPDESECGKSNFAVIECYVQSLEWLYLKHSGHLRCKFDRSSGVWLETWVAP